MPPVTVVKRDPATYAVLDHVVLEDNSMLPQDFNYVFVAGQVIYEGQCDLDFVFILFRLFTEGTLALLHRTLWPQLSVELVRKVISH